MNIVMMAEVWAEKVIGGVERMLRQRSLWLCRRGHFVSLISRLGNNDSTREVDIGGDGPLRPVLEQRIDELDLKGEVVLQGFTEEEQLPAYYQCADAVVMATSALEGFGMVTVEALACGRPVIGTPVGATPEILSQINPRLIAAGKDPEPLAQTLSGILTIIANDGSARERRREESRTVVEESYNWGRCALLLEEALAWPQ